MVEAVRKHYSLGPAPAEPWRRPLEVGEGLGLGAFNVSFATSEAAARTAARPSALVTGSSSHG
jgi:hypothetical protein